MFIIKVADSFREADEESLTALMEQDGLMLILGKGIMTAWLYALAESIEGDSVWQTLERERAEDDASN